MDNSSYHIYAVAGPFALIRREKRVKKVKKSRLSANEGKPSAKNPHTSAANRDFRKKFALFSLFFTFFCGTRLTKISGCGIRVYRPESRGGIVM
jgi:hypothetical protein